MTEREDTRLVDYLYGELSKEEASEYRRSLDSDAEKKAEVEGYEEMLSMFRQVEDEEPAPHLDSLILANARQLADAAQADALERGFRGWLRKVLRSPLVQVAVVTSLVVAIAAPALLVMNRADRPSPRSELAFAPAVETAAPSAAGGKPADVKEEAAAHAQATAVPKTGERQEADNTLRGQALDERNGAFEPSGAEAPPEAKPSPKMRPMRRAKKDEAPSREPSAPAPTMSRVAKLEEGGPRPAHHEPRGASPEAGSGPGRMYGGAQDVRREPRPDAQDKLAEAEAAKKPSAPREKETRGASPEVGSGPDRMSGSAQDARRELGAESKTRSTAHAADVESPQGRDDGIAQGQAAHDAPAEQPRARASAPAQNVAGGALMDEDRSTNIAGDMTRAADGDLARGDVQGARRVLEEALRRVQGTPSAGTVELALARLELGQKRYKEAKAHGHAAYATRGFRQKAEVLSVLERVAKESGDAGELSWVENERLRVKLSR